MSSWVYHVRILIGYVLQVSSRTLEPLAIKSDITCKISPWGEIFPVTVIMKDERSEWEQFLDN